MMEAEVVETVETTLGTESSLLQEVDMKAGATEDTVKELTKADILLEVKTDSPLFPQVAPEHEEPEAPILVRDVMRDKDPSTHCLFCWGFNAGESSQNQIPCGEDVPESLQSTFVELCSLMLIEFPEQWSSWDFETEPYPFCTLCRSEVAELVQLQKQVQGLQEIIRKSLLKISVTAVESERRRVPSRSESNAASPVVLSESKEIPDNKYQYFRNTVIQRYNPVVALQSLKELRFPKNDLDVENSHQDWKAHYDLEAGDSDFDPLTPVDQWSDDGAVSTSYTEETPQPVKKKRNYRIQRNKERENRLIDGVPETLKYWEEVQIVDLETKTYSVDGFNIQEVENGFKCLHCFQVCKIRPNRGVRARFSLIIRHVQRVHVAPKSDRQKSATLIDDKTMTYTLRGFKFQKIDNHFFKCLVCTKLISVRSHATHKQSQFSLIRTHIVKVHVGKKRPHVHVHTAERAEGPTPIQEDSKNGELAELPPDNNSECAAEDCFEPTAALELVYSEDVNTGRGNVSTPPPPPPSSLQPNLFPVSKTKKEYDIRDAHLQVVDAANKKFSLYNVVIRDVDTGFECSLCSKVVKYSVNLPGRRQRGSHYNMRYHILRTHIDKERRLKGKVFVLDAAAKTYVFHGFKIQEVGDNVLCLTCKELCPQSTNFHNRFMPAKRHIWNKHERGMRPIKAILIDERTKTYAYNKHEFRDINRGLECSTCKTVIRKWSAMTEHIDKEHKTIVHKCPLCPYMSEKSLRFKTHMSTKHSADSEKVICDVCGKLCKNSLYLSRHLAYKHGDIPEERVQCDQCDKTLKNRYCLRVHMNEIHGNQKAFMCDQCGQGFPRKNSLANHILSAHTQERRFKCDKCGKAYPYATGLKRHQLTFHQGYKFPHKYPCTTCGKKFQSMGVLNRHQKEVHLGIRPPPKKRIRNKKKKVLTPHPSNPLPASEQVHHPPTTTNQAPQFPDTLQPGPSGLWFGGDNPYDPWNK